MRLIQLYLHPFAGTVDKTYRFQEGLNVIYGHNEAGKSTIVKALLMALTTTTVLTKLEFKNQVSSFIPIGGDSINIDLNFEVEGVEYLLKKSWGVNNASSLSIVGQAAINNAEKVQEELFRLLNLNKATVRDVIFTTQAKIASTIEGVNNDADIKNSLDNILRGAILNTGGVVPETLRSQLEQEYENLTQNWKLDEDMPVVKTNNKGAYENKWANGVGEILKLAYALYDKQKELEKRLQYDQNYTLNADELNEVRTNVNNDQQYILKNAPLVGSLDKRKEINVEIEKIQQKIEKLKEVHLRWNNIIANLPVLSSAIISDEEQFISLKQELDNARLYIGASVKIAKFDNILNLKSQKERSYAILNSLKIVTDQDIASVKLIQDPLSEATTALNGLLAAQKFVVNLLPKKDIEVEIQHSGDSAQKNNLIAGNPLSLSVNQGFMFTSAEITIEVKSLTDQINILNAQIIEFKNQMKGALAKFENVDYDTLLDLNQQYNQANSNFKFDKNTYDNAIAGTTYEALEQEANILQNLPKTREVNELEKLYDALNLKIAADKKTLAVFEVDKDRFEVEFGSLDKIDDLRLDLIQEERQAQSKLSNLPAISEGFDIELFRNEYQVVNARLDVNKERCRDLEVERAGLEGSQPESSSAELQDEIDLLNRQKAQKVEEAKAVSKVLNKLDEILNRAPVNPYQDYEVNVSQYLNILSGGKYKTKTDGLATPSLIKNSQTNLALPVELLSQGTAGILGLSLRLAMADYYLDGQNGFLAFDDPMVDFDEERQQFAAQCLQQYATEKQVFIFTCHQAHANQLGGYLINLN
jgi:exonuclease SbcC